VGHKAILGAPNKNAFKYLTRILGFKFLYNLPYYVLPVDLKKIMPRRFGSLLNIAYYPLLRIYLVIHQFIGWISSSVEKKSAFNISYSETDFLKRFNDTYTTIKKSNTTFTYKLFQEEDICTAYLFDFRQKGIRNSRALSNALNHIIANEKVDLITFIGKLSMRQLVLLPVPLRRIPKPLPLTIDILVPDSDELYQELAQPENWNFGLLNFDVR
jgi:hypothetical protein